MEGTLADVIGWTSLVAGLGCLVIALILAVKTSAEVASVKTAAKKVADKTTAAAEKNDETFQKQAGALSTGLEAVAKLAAALKDLDRVAQLLTVSLGFFSIAGVVAGLEQVATAIAK